MEKREIGKLGKSKYMTARWKKLTW
jgi:hypothetical protein